MPLTSLSRSSAALWKNLPLVSYTLKKYAGFAIARYGWEDMFQVGCVGLVKGAAKYNPSRGAFSTYAVRAIRSEILTHCRRQLAQKRVPPNGSQSMDQPAACQLPADPAADVEARYYASDLLAFLHAEAKSSPRSGIVVRAALGRINQREAARRLGVSQPQVSRLVKSLRQRVSGFQNPPNTGGSQ